ncbi:MAG: hypothetical protein DI586_10705 [Micavibrio aeruginosavorus]|jgi:hypothetical protein|uniref:Uncharacterized protein n=1 Tax=Micavibrio aeruginosavorus TaxID=349221 RepID=A0A2W5FHA2_9BACT|nr:MAG: hypothetical protein DI586_10705 [Micavibrio aeruginosavorus]
MSSDKLDKLIKGLAASQPRFDSLQTMESRVWQSINRRRVDMPRNVIEGWLASLFVPEYRLASLSFALIVGVFAATLSVSSPQPANAAQALNLHVFSSNYGITSTVILAKNGG